MKNFKKKKKKKNRKVINKKKTLLFSAATRIVFLAWKTLKFGFLYFWKSCIEFNLISKNTNLESIGILNGKLEPKYEASAAEN